MSANVLAFTARQAPAWWDLEGLHTFDLNEELTVTDAMTRAGLDYELEKLESFVTIRGVKVATGDHVVVRPALAQDPVPRVLGHVSPGFAVVQNQDVARVLDPISGEWPVETVGALGHGEVVFATLFTGGWDVRRGAARDEVRGYFLVTDHKAGGGALTLAYTPVRVVCQNTLQLGLSQAEVRVDLRHTQGAVELLELNAAIMAQLRHAETAARELLQSLADEAMPADHVAPYLAHVYPDPATPSRVRPLLELEQLGYDTDDAPALARELGVAEDTVDTAIQARRRYAMAMDRARDRRALVRERYDRFNDENPAWARTKWAAYQTVTEYADWRQTGRASGRDVLFGDRAAEKKRAAEYLVAHT